MTVPIEWLRAIPKAELHLHLEGTLEPEMMFGFASRNGIALPFSSVEQVRAAYRFSRLDDFLQIYYQGMSVLLTEEDFFDLTLAYLQRAHADGVRHAEVFFDPQGHTARGVPFDVVIDGIYSALECAEKRFGISTALILCFLRHLPEQSAFETLVEARAHLSKLAGVGLDSSERGNPPEKFQRVFAAARELGLRCVAHAGEEGPADYVRQALDVLKVERVDHGNRALDDPAYFGGYVLDNYVAVAEALQLSKAEIATLAANSLRGSFMPGPRIEALMAELASLTRDA
jgi:adenosine deaminase